MVGAWSVRIDERRRALDLADRFADEGRAYVELDDEARVIRQEPHGRTGA